MAPTTFKMELFVTIVNTAKGLDLPFPRARRVVQNSLIVNNHSQE